MLSNYLQIYLDILSHISIPRNNLSKGNVDNTVAGSLPPPDRSVLPGVSVVQFCQFLGIHPVTPGCSGPAAAWLGMARPVRPVPSKTLLSPVLGTPQLSSLQPCVPRPGPSTDTRPRLAGSDTNTENRHKQIGECREGVENYCQQCLQSGADSSRRLNGFGQREGSRQGREPWPRPG